MKCEPLSPLHPLAPLAPGRYRLDDTGWLWPVAMKIPLHTVCIVTVKGKPTPLDRQREEAKQRLRAECAAEAKEQADRVQEAKRLTTAHHLPIRNKPEPVAAPTRTARRQEPRQTAKARRESEDMEAVSEFAEKLADVQRRRAEGEPVEVKKVVPPKTDGARLAQAIRNRPPPKPPEKKKPTRRALTDGECHQCGVRTRIGCEHFLPYEGG